MTARFVDGEMATAGYEAREWLLANFLSRRWAVQVQHLGKKSAVDWAIYRAGQEVGAAEVKIREKRLGTYRAILVPVRKILALQHYTRRTGLPGIVIYYWPGPTLAWGDIAGIDPDTAQDFGGWYDTPGGAVPQRCVLVPREKFTFLELSEADREALKGLPS